MTFYRCHYEEPEEAHPSDCQEVIFSDNSVTDFKNSQNRLAYRKDGNLIVLDGLTGKRLLEAKVDSKEGYRFEGEVLHYQENDEWKQLK